MEADQLRHLLGQLLLKKAFVKLGVDPNLYHKIAYNEFGRPFIKGFEQIDFNISHSGNYVICSMAENLRVGVDIEEVKEVDLDEFRDVMSQRQWREIHSDKEKARMFFTYWVIKESVIKADGRGLSVNLRNIRIFKDFATCGGYTWNFKILHLDAMYCSCLSYNARHVAIQLELIDW